MKKTIDDLERTYDVCLANGNFRQKSEVDIEKIKSLKIMAERGLAFSSQLQKNLKKESSDWTFILRDYYESLRSFIDAFLLFDCMAVESHQCKNAYICFKYDSLGFDWEFLEIVRLKRNAINYEGIPVKYEEWNKFKIEFDIHIKILRDELERRIKEQNL